MMYRAGIDTLTALMATASAGAKWDVDVSFASFIRRADVMAAASAGAKCEAGVVFDG